MLARSWCCDAERRRRRRRRRTRRRTTTRRKRRTAIRARTERSENERIGDRLPAMEKRIELEKRGKNPGDVRQHSDFFYCAAHRLPPIFISSPHFPLPPRARERACVRACVSLFNVRCPADTLRVFARVSLLRGAVDQRASRDFNRASLVHAVVIQPPLGVSRVQERRSRSR